MTPRLFLRKPIEIGGFVLDQYGAHPRADCPRPTKQGWLEAAEFITAMGIATPYWLGDHLRWLEDTSGWDEHTIEQLVSDTGWTRERIYNAKYVATHVGREARELAPSISHATAVASLQPKQQLVVLKRAREEGLTAHQTRKVVRKLVRPRVVDDQAELRGEYRVILADPPWAYDNDSTRDDGSLAGAASSYDSLTIEEICKLPVEAHAQKNAVLFLWTTNSHLFDNPGPREVIEAWGFNYKTNYCWSKVLGMPGNYSYSVHELLLVCTRGSCTPDVDILQHDHASIFTERRRGEHSEKPEFAYKLIESLYPEGHRLELFARKPREGWAAYGNDPKLWRATA